MAPDTFGLGFDFILWAQAALLSQPIYSALGVGAALLWIAGQVFTLAFQQTRA
jgi:hypothetical protein